MFDSFQEETMDRNLIKNTPGVKRSSQELKKALLKGVKSNGWSMPPGFDRFQTLVMMNSLQNTATLGAQGLLMLMRSNFLIKMTRQNIKVKEQCFAAW